MSEPTTRERATPPWITGIGIGLTFAAARIGAEVGDYVGGASGKWVGVVIFAAVTAAAFSWMSRRYGESATKQIVLAICLYFLLPLLMLGLSLHWAGLVD